MFALVLLGGLVTLPVFVVKQRMKVQPAVEPLVLILRLYQLQEVPLRQVLQVNMGLRFFILVLIDMAVLELAVLIKVTERLFCFLICRIISKLVIIPTMICILPTLATLFFFFVIIMLLSLGIWIFIFHRLIFSKNFLAFALFVNFFSFLFAIGRMHFFIDHVLIWYSVFLHLAKAHLLVVAADVVQLPRPASLLIAVVVSSATARALAE